MAAAFHLIFWLKYFKNYIFQRDGFVARMAETVLLPLLLLLPTAEPLIEKIWESECAYFCYWRAKHNINTFHSASCNSIEILWLPYPKSHPIPSHWRIIIVAGLLKMFDLNRFNNWKTFFIFWFCSWHMWPAKDPEHNDEPDGCSRRGCLFQVPGWSH